jgi:hypothetical protein
MVRLRIHIGNREPLSLDVGPGLYTLGRADENTIVVDLPGLCEKQIEFRVSEALQVFVRDLSDRGELTISGRSVFESFVKPSEIVTSGGVIVMVDLLGGEPSESDQPSVENQSAGPGFFQLLPDAFKYPLQGDTMFVVTSVAVVGGLVSLFAGLMSFVGMLIGWAIGIYLLLTFREIITSTINGEDRIPAEPLTLFNREELKEVLVPLFAIVLLPMLPFHLSRNWPDAPDWLHPTFGFLALVYIPMGILLLLVTGGGWAAHPGNVILSILRAPVGYFGVLILLVLIVGSMSFIGDSVRPMAGGHRYVTIGLNTLLRIVELYLAFVWARALGLYYRSNRIRLQWE